MQSANATKRIIVVGASGAIGLEIARTCALAGYKVLATYNRSKGPSIDGLYWAKLDVCAKASFARVLNPLDDNHETEAIIYCAGITADSPFTRITEEDWERTIAVNLSGAFYAIQAVVEKMMLAGRGRIILLGSISSRVGVKGQANYTASKAGLEGLCHTLAEELAPFGITTNVLATGPIESPMMQETQESRKNQLLKQIPLRRFGKRNEIAGTVMFLLSDAASYMNGQTVVLDGGLYKI